MTNRSVRTFDHRLRFLALTIGASNTAVYVRQGACYAEFVVDGQKRYTDNTYDLAALNGLLGDLIGQAEGRERLGVGTSRLKLREVPSTLCIRRY